MKILSWNCIGAGSKEFRTRFLDIKREQNLDVVFLLETKVDNSRAKRLSLNLGFTDSICAPVTGRSGGIWLLWNSGDNKVDVGLVTDQIIHAIVGPKNENGWLCSAVYASPHLGKRGALWEDIKELSSVVNIPWLVTGDLNDIYGPSEKHGGRSINWNRDNKFRSMIEECGFIDLGFYGLKFTWRGRRSGGCKVREHLDRSLANWQWREKFSDGTRTSYGVLSLVMSCDSSGVLASIIRLS